MTAHLKNPSKTPSRLSLRDHYRRGGPLACRRSSCVPFDNQPLMGHRNRPHRSERQALYGPRRGRGRDFSARRRPPTGGFNEQREREDGAWLIVCAVGPRMTDVVVLTMSEFGRAEPSLDPVGRGGGQSDPCPRREPGVPPCGSSG